MSPEQRRRVESFLRAAEGTPLGRVLLVNMLDSLKAGLVPALRLREFLLACALTHEGMSSMPATAVAEDVAMGRGADRRPHLRLARRTFTEDDDASLSTTLKTDTLFRFFISDDYKLGLSPVVLPANPVDSPSGLQEYRELLAAVVSDPRWFRPGATVGRPLPEPYNCWLTSDEFGLDRTGPHYGDDNGTAARDALGLIDNIDGCFLVRLTFRAAEVAAVAGLEVARPTFTDLGNARFRVGQTSLRATQFAAAGWGATVHLGKRAANPTGDATGESERVASGIPLAAIPGVSIELLGRVTIRRAADESHLQFSDWVVAGRTLKDIRDDILLELE